MSTIHVYRAARTYFVDGISWGDDAEGVRFYLQVTGVPPEEITKALGLQRHLYPHVFKHKELGASKKPLMLVADDRKPVILHRQILAMHSNDVVGVQWRKRSQGTRSKQGNRWVERVLSVQRRETRSQMAHAARVPASVLHHVIGYVCGTRQAHRPSRIAHAVARHEGWAAVRNSEQIARGQSFYTGQPRGLKYCGAQHP